jgi:hypothetical protein
MAAVTDSLANFLMSVPPIRLDVVDDVFWLRFSDHIRSLHRNSLFSLIGPPGIGREFRGDQFKMRERIKRSGHEHVTLRESNFAHAMPSGDATFEQTSIGSRSRRANCSLVVE